MKKSQREWHSMRCNVFERKRNVRFAFEALNLIFRAGSHPGVGSKKEITPSHVFATVSPFNGISNYISIIVKRQGSKWNIQVPPRNFNAAE